jgi:3-oxoacyl-[acyl-carrier-protein] synthase III
VIRGILSGLGAWLPPLIVTNAEICAGLDLTPEWIEKRTGIKERRVVSGGLSIRDLAVNAGRKALQSYGGSDVDTVIVATTSPDRLCPAVAPEVATLLGLSEAGAYDINSACSGFIYGLATANGLITSEAAKAVLLICSEVFTPLVNPADRATRPIFGDGAGAVILRRGESSESGAIGPVRLGSDGGGADLLSIPAGGCRQRAATGLAHTQLPVEDWYLHMDGPAIFGHAVNRMTQSARVVLSLAGWSGEDVDWFVGHQANIRILQGVGYELGLSKAKIASNIDRTGNTLAASIPLLLSDMAQRGDLQPGNRVLLGAFGAGLSWGATTIVWPELSVDGLE